MCIYIYIYVYIHIHTYLYIYIYTHTHVCMCVYIYIYIYIYTHVYTHVIHMYIYIYICLATYMCNPEQRHEDASFGWHYLSNATCLTRPRLFLLFFVVLRSGSQQLQSIMVTLLSGSIAASSGLAHRAVSLLIVSGLAHRTGCLLINMNIK